MEMRRDATNALIRTLGGIAGGIAVAIMLMMVVEAIGLQLYPPPMGLELEGPDAAARMPFATLIFPVIGWFVGPLVGGFLAIWTSRSRWASWPVAAAIVIGALLQFALARHPFWMIAAGIAAPLAGAWLAQLPARRRAGPAD